MSFRKMTFGSLRQIRKPDAFKLFAEGKPFVMCGSNMRPGPPWNPEYYVYPEVIADWKYQAEWYKPGGMLDYKSDVWEKDTDTTAFNMMLRNFEFYLSNEEGRYAAFYERMA